MIEYGGHRLPGRTPRPAVEIPRPEPVKSIQLVGRLVGVEGNNSLEVLHLDLQGADCLAEQLALPTMVDQQVVITVELARANAQGPRLVPERGA